MKQALGKRYILFILLFLSFLKAEDFTYDFKVDNANPYVKEAVILTLDVVQTNHDIVLLFDFDVKPSESYTFQRIDSKEIDAYHAAQIRYTYLIYPLQEGKVDLQFHLIQKAATDDSVAYSFSGDRDSVKALVTQDSKIDVAPFSLNVKALPEGTEVVGDFSVDYKVKTLKGKPFEPLPLQVTLQGQGYPPVFDNLLPLEGNFTRFTEAPEVKSLATLQGTRSTVTYPMALSHDKDFTLKALDIQGFNPKTQKRYTLLVPEQHFKITESNTSLLLDKTDNPAPFHIDWSWIENFLKYFFVFGVGFFSAWVTKEFKTWKRPKSTELHGLFQEKVNQCKTTKALLQLLLAVDAKMFHKQIDTLESSLYGTEKITLSEIKKEIMETLK